MSKLLVSGLINIETTVQIDSFPVHYTPVRYPFFGVHTTVSGVGYNVAKALATLGDSVSLLSLIGRDFAGSIVRETLEATGLSTEFVLDSLPSTPQSAILYETGGRRMINVDLKDIQESAYSEEKFHTALQNSDLAILCNINFSRPFLDLAHQAGVRVATDVHSVSDLEDPYNKDFMAAADILFMSDEQLPCAPEDWVKRVWDRFGAEILVIGLGAQGALLAVRRDGLIERYPTVFTRNVVNTIGAGDALFSCFLHEYLKTQDPYTSLRKAMVFASYKIGESGAADGFLSEAELEREFIRIKVQENE